MDKAAKIIKKLRRDIRSGTLEKVLVTVSKTTLIDLNDPNLPGRMDRLIANGEQPVGFLCVPQGFGPGGRSVSVQFLPQYEDQDWATLYMEKVAQEFMADAVARHIFGGIGANRKRKK